MKIVDIVGYILNNYPHKSELAKARINKIIYLMDWKSSIDRGKQISDIEWIFNHYGPYVDDVENEIRNDERLKISMTFNYYNNPKYLIELTDENVNFNEPNDEEKEILDLVIEVTKKLNWDDFINAVYSTYPITHSEKGSNLNLVKLAKEYNTLKEEQ